MPAMNPESVYFEPTNGFSFDPKTGKMDVQLGVTIHAKIGARWERLMLVPDEGEPIGELYKRLGQWSAEEPQTFASELFQGRDRARSGDS